MRFTLCLATSLAAAPALAQDGTLRVPGLSPEAEAEAPACENVPYSQENCVRVLACIGDEGLWFDGQARGWDTGPVAGGISDGTTCEGVWSADGPGGAGVSHLTCSDGAEIGVIYTQQDNETGTVIGQGMDSFGRAIRVWSGLNVLRFLTPDGRVGAELPCGDEPVPIS